MLFLASWAAMMGPLAYVQHLASGPRLPFTAAYFGSIGLTLYFALGVSNDSPCLRVQAANSLLSSTARSSPCCRRSSNWPAWHGTWSATFLWGRPACALPVALALGEPWHGCQGKEPGSSRSCKGAAGRYPRLTTKKYGPAPSPGGVRSMVTCKRCFGFRSTCMRP